MQGLSLNKFLFHGGESFGLLPPELELGGLAVGKPVRVWLVVLFIDIKDRILIYFGIHVAHDTTNAFNVQLNIVPG